MSNDSRPVLERAAETDDLDFKSGFHNNLGEWLEVIKDIVAFANSGGGTILFGVDDDGLPTGNAVSDILAADPADVTNRIYKYTGTHFHAFEISRAEKDAHEICVISIRATKIPLVFTSIGNYEVDKGKQKTAFNIGTVYFRHGAKSEPGNSNDLRAFLDREVDSIKTSWLAGIAKVVEAPAGSHVAIIPPDGQTTGLSETSALQLTNDPKATPVYAIPIDTTHPYRQKEVLEILNEKMDGRKITSHDLLCIRRAHEVDEKIELCYTQKHASNLYSEQFIDWVLKMYKNDTQFFVAAKEKYDELKAKTK